MLLLLMRHGVAEERETWTEDDDLRPLTKDGEKKTREAARGLRVLVERIDLIAASPLVRAQQTAAIAGEVYPQARRETWEELAGAAFSPLAARLKEQKFATVLLAGHEPGFSMFAAELLTGKAGGFALEFKKAAVCALQVEWGGRAPRAALLWHAPPKLLRAL